MRASRHSLFGSCAVVLGRLGALNVAALWAWYFPDLQRAYKIGKAAG
jgi:hypothetical protein